MSPTPTTPAPALSDVTIAAGGLVFRDDSAHMRIAVVQRPRAQGFDWVLPKGHREPDDASYEAAAWREVQEETRAQAKPGAFLGSYAYLDDEGRPKVVLMWRMVRVPAAYARPAPATEVHDVQWLAPEEAVARLSHENEREFVTRHCLGRVQRPKSWFGRKMTPHAKLDRLASELKSTHAQFEVCLRRLPASAPAGWEETVRRSLHEARRGLLAADLDAGWGALHDAERLLIFGLSAEDLLARALTLKAEVLAKLKRWRRRGVAELFAALKLTAWRRKPALFTAEARTLTEAVVIEALFVLHQDSDNIYHRLRLVGRQLTYLLTACGLLLAAVLLAAAQWAEAGSAFRLGLVGPVALAGAIGGVVSAVLQLSRVGQQKIPEALLHGLITSGRPIVGAACGLAIYALMQSGIVTVLTLANEDGDPLAAAVIVAFFAGFSERFFLGAVATATGDNRRSSDDNGDDAEPERDVARGEDRGDHEDDDGDKPTRDAAAKPTPAVVPITPAAEDKSAVKPSP